MPAPIAVALLVQRWVLNRVLVRQVFTSTAGLHVPHLPALNLLPEYGTVTPPPSSFAAASAPPHTLRLLCHPATPCRVALTLTCTVSDNRPASDGLGLRFELCADLSALRIPQPAPCLTTDGSTDGLWQHTCFEAFVRREGDAAYQEFNFSPSGQWAHYRFSAERIRDPAAALASPGEFQAPPSQLSPAPRLQVEHHADRLVLYTTLLPCALTTPSTDERLRLALSAVVEDRAGRLSYWALHHPLDRPDFHHPAGFVHVLHAQPAN